MEFTKNTLNYASNYGDFLHSVFPKALYYGAFYGKPNDKRYNWLNAKTIEVPLIEMSGRVDSDRDTITSKSRKYNITWVPLTIARERMWSSSFHPRDIAETNNALSVENITAKLNNDLKFPEMDAYFISKLYSEYLKTGKLPDSVTLTSTNVLAVFDRLMERMNEKGVPIFGRMLYITPAVDTMLKIASGITRNSNVVDPSGAVYRAVSYLDQVQIVTVPSDRMKSLYTFTEGYKISQNAKQISMLLVHPDSVIAPVSYDISMLDPPSAVNDGMYIYYEESHEDVFILPKAEMGVEFVTEEIALAGLSATSAASNGGTSGRTSLTLSTPKSLNSHYSYKTSSTNNLTLPSFGSTLDSSWLNWDGTSDIAVTNAHYLALIEANSDNKAIVGTILKATASV